MSHGYALRVPLGSGAEPDAARLDRMRACGWQVTALAGGAVLAARGVAGSAKAGGTILCGMAFAEDLPPAHDTSDLAFLAERLTAAGPEALDEMPGALSVVALGADGTIRGWRDGFGLYPFFYVQHDGALTCGSDIRACLHLSGLPLEVAPDRIADFIRGEDNDTARTAFAGLHRLPPGHRLSVRDGLLHTTPTWTPTLPAADPGEDAARRLRSALCDATAARMRPAGRVGAMLSGGLDSSALAGLAAGIAAERGSAPPQTLSFTYGADKPYDETRYIDAACSAFGTPSHRIAVTGPAPLADLGPLIEEQMEPFLAPGLQKSRRIYAKAQALGLAALIDGHGGDEVISHGYGHLAALAAGWRLPALWRAAKGAASVHGLPVWGVVLGHLGRYGGLRRGHPLRRVLMRLARWQTARSRLADAPDPGPGLVAPALRRDPDPQTPEAEIDPQEVERRAHLRSLTDPLLTGSFEVLHRSAVAAGVLPRYPFLDRRVVTLCLGLGADTKLRDGQTRWILREAMKGVLPEEIRSRPDKAEFGREVAAAVTDYFRDTGPERFDALADFVDPAAARALRDAVLDGRRPDAPAIRALWRLAVLIEWQKAFAGWQAAQASGRLVA